MDENGHCSLAKKRHRGEMLRSSGGTLYSRHRPLQQQQHQQQQRHQHTTILSSSNISSVSDPTTETGVKRDSNVGDVSSSDLDQRKDKQELLVVALPPSTSNSSYSCSQNSNDRNVSPDGVEHWYKSDDDNSNDDDDDDQDSNQCHPEHSPDRSSQTSVGVRFFRCVTHFLTVCRCRRAQEGMGNEPSKKQHQQQQQVSGSKRTSAASATGGKFFRFWCWSKRLLLLLLFL